MCPLTCPITHTKILVLIGTTIIAFIFGFLWYGPLFGKTWATLNGIKIPDNKEGCTKPPVSSMLLAFLGNFLTVWVIAFIIHQPAAPCSWGVALFAWLGYQIPILLSTVAWERKPWALFGLNAAYYFLNLQLIATILTYWK